ncbi:MAG TPA: UDP-N-acetylglucosamine 1-carboxyvinyltransferase [Chloroflexota bacterium]|nr:UDP-N-acetylglucosamine 1-carboxyvinyltransferase [Chloroflexota bacterium]
MEKFVLEGQFPLRGSVRTNGAKNAALPIMAAALLTTEECLLDNVPMVRDVRTMAELLRRLGCRVTVDEVAHRVTVRAPERADLGTAIPPDLAGQMRASFLTTGPVLARAGRVRAPHPGGCSIGKRPVNVDIRSFSAMGARVSLVDDLYDMHADTLRGKSIYLDYPSHTGTENVLLAATLAKGTTVLKHAATEPEVADLVSCLTQMGARIRGVGPSYLVVEGVDTLGGFQHRVMPDRIEAGTYAIAAAISRGEVIIQDIVPDHMDPLTHKLQEVGVIVEIDRNNYLVRGIGHHRPVEVQTLHFPGFPTDLQSTIATLLTQSDGTSLIHERVFDDRLQYTTELRKFGATISVTGHTATIMGPTPLRGASVRALDLRCGAALILAGLAAEGVTEIDDIYHIDRGYENVLAQLVGLGAHMERVASEPAAASA